MTASAPQEPAYRYRLRVAYVGTAYAGWQRQANAPSIQGELERALADLVGEPVIVQGAGRTDAGVHARGQVAHLDLSRPFSTDGLVFGGNFRLPGAIRILDAAAVSPEFHAQFSAVAKEYRYRFYRARLAPPELAPFVTLVPSRLDLGALRAATFKLVGRHDFAAFALAGSSYRTTVRTLYRAAWEEAGPELFLTCLGDGFLRGMVRGLAGTLLEVAEGRRSISGVAGLLHGAGRGAAGPTAPASGLSLDRVDYPPTERRSPASLVVA